MTIFRCSTRRVGGLIAAAALSACDVSPATVSNAASSPAAVAVLIDVPSYIGKPKAEVDALWGQPVCPPRNSCEYQGDRSVFYVAGKAANFTLPPIQDLRSYGLELGRPDFENGEIGLKRWTISLGNGSAEVSQFPNYVYIKTEEP